MRSLASWTMSTTTRWLMNFVIVQGPNHPGLTDIDNDGLARNQFGPERYRSHIFENRPHINQRTQKETSLVLILYINTARTYLARLPDVKSVSKVALKMHKRLSSQLF